MNSATARLGAPTTSSLMILKIRGECCIMCVIFVAFPGCARPWRPRRTRGLGAPVRGLPGAVGDRGPGRRLRPAGRSVDWRGARVAEGTVTENLCGRCGGASYARVRRDTFGATDSTRRRCWWRADTATAQRQRAVSDFFRLLPTSKSRSTPHLT